MWEHGLEIMGLELSEELTPSRTAARKRSVEDDDAEQEYMVSTRGMLAFLFFWSAKKKLLSIVDVVVQNPSMVCCVPSLDGGVHVLSGPMMCFWSLSCSWCVLQRRHGGTGSRAMFP